LDTSIITQVLGEEVTRIIINISLFVIAVVLTRFLIVWFVNTLASNRVISFSARTIIIKVLDILIIASIIVVSIHLITASLTPYVIAVIIGVLTFLLFYYEIKEFTAFITVHLQKFTKGSWIEIVIPKTGEVLKGRIVDVQLFNSVLEDLHGNKTYIANSLLVNSIIREYRPRIFLRLKLNGLGGNDALMNINMKVIDKIKGISSELPFRFEESKVFIESVSNSSTTLSVELTPLAIPIRATDVTKLTRYVMNALKELNPEIEIKLI